jgi:hypothetical protein
MISILGNVVAGSKCKYGGAIVLHSHARIKTSLEGKRNASVNANSGEVRSR